LYKTFSAREKPMPGGQAFDLARAARKKYFGDKNTLRDYIAKTAHKYDAIILAGAGDINKILQ
jgi:UDP-N-acetylmuramate-alanine ligase